MEERVFTVAANEPAAPGTYRMLLNGDTGAITRPGQFVNIRLDGFFLRRPISVSDWDDGLLCIIYKVVGRGTAYMSSLLPGARLDILTGLGNGFDVSKSGSSPLLVGGGAGVAPMYALARVLLSRGTAVHMIAGFNTAGEIYLKDEFEALGAELTITTADGSFGRKGFATDAMDCRHSYVYACGPEPMLKAVCNASAADGQYSFEERMGCGFGACMGCTCKTKYGSKRICKDGPVLEKEEIVW